MLDLLIKKKFFSHPAPVLLGIFVMALSLRLINLGIEPFWGDEILSLDISQYFSSVKEMVRYLGDVELHPPLYYILIHFWTKWFGSSEFAVRLVSVLFGLGTVLLGYFFAQMLTGSKKAAYLTAFILAILPMQIEYSQEARPYVIFTFLGLLAAFSIWKFQNHFRLPYLALYVLSSVAGLYLMYSYVFILAATALWSLYMALSTPANRSRNFTIWLAAHGLILLGFSPWLKNFLYRIVLGKFILYDLTRNPSTGRVDTMIGLVLEGLIWLNKSVSSSYWAIVVKLTSLAALAWSGLIFFGKVLADYTKKRVSLFLASLFFIPFAFYIVSPLSSPYITIYYRHLLFLNIPFAVFLGWLIASMPWKPAVTVMTVFTLSLVPNMYEITENDGLWDSNFMVADMAQFVNEHYRPGDLVIVVVAYGRTNFTHYLNEEIPVTALLPAAYYGGDVWSSRHTLGMIENEYQTRAGPVQAVEVEKKLDRLIKIYKPKRIWLYGIKSGDFTVHNWFRGRKWFRVFQSIQDVFVIDLYTKPPPQE